MIVYVFAVALQLIASVAPTLYVLFDIFVLPCFNVTLLYPELALDVAYITGNSKIKSLVNSLTSGLTTDHAKALAIYNYVIDKISYSFYYDTRHGAVGTLDAKSGSCVDQSH